jgi:hypothetical protein
MAKSRRGRGVNLTAAERQEVYGKIRKLLAKGLSHRQIAKKVGVSHQLVHRVSKQSPEPEAEPEKPEKKGPVRISHIPVKEFSLPKGVVHRFLVSSAQDEAKANVPLVENMEAYAAFCGAQIILGPGTYQKGIFESHAVETGVYDERIRRYIMHDRIQVTEDLLIVTAANILPTTANPLQGFQTANRGGHVIIPHARVAMQSIPRILGQPPRYAISTGTVTEPSYAPRAAGQKAIFHHTFGFTMVEIDTDGEVFMRPVTATPDGSFQDLDVYVCKGRCYPGRRVKAISWGDIHFEQMNPSVAMASWGFDMATRKCVPSYNMLDTLNPEFQFLHDTLDFRRRNHHSINDPHLMAMVLRDTSGNVEQEVREAAAFVNAVRRDFCQTVMVESNHDAALAKWLKNPDGAKDSENSYFWHELNGVWYRAIRAANDGFNVVEHAMRECGLADDVEFVRSGSSYRVDDVECGLHGDLGISGSRGTPQQFRRFGAKTTSGHTHSPLIVDGAYVSGVSARMDQGYNPGPTTWAHAHVLQYYNAKRTIVCMSQDGRHRAIGDIAEFALAA